VAAETALVIAIAASFVHALRGHALRTSDDAIIAIELRADGAAAVKIGKAGWHDARILGTTYVTPLLTVLNLKLDGYRIPRHVVILPDMVAGEDFRHLRVILRWQSERESTPTGGDSARSSGPSMRALP
jgi:hypothetical protein